MFVESAVAVEREIIGRDREGLLIGGVAELRKSCSWARLAASRAAAADCASALDLGDVEKNCAIRLGFTGFLNRVLPFSERGEKDGQGVAGELLTVEFRRGMVNSAPATVERQACGESARCIC